jgi:hypothetical protein
VPETPLTTQTPDAFIPLTWDFVIWREWLVST